MAARSAEALYLINLALLSQSEMDAKVIPAVREGFQASVVRDCTALSSPPACGCAANSPGKLALDLFEQGTKDCMITVTEAKTNSLIMSLFTPDVTVEGQPSLSFGVKATAVEAGFVAP